MLSTQMSSIKSPRMPFIDWLRGLSILLMVIYHFSYDLDLFGYIDTAFGKGLWIPFRYIIVIGFLTLVGVSLVIVHHEQINWKSVNKRSVQLLIAGLLVSASGYFVAAHKITVFGILQLILVSSLLVLPVIKKPVAALVLGICVFVIGHTYTSSVFNNVWLHWLGMAEIIRPALDYVPIFPWLGIVSIGVYVGHWFISDKGRKVGAFTLSQHSNLIIRKTHQFIEIMGQHSLVIYLVHQPIMFGAFYALEQLKFN